MQSIQEKDLRVELETITADSRKVDRLSSQSSYLFSLSLSSDSQFFFSSFTDGLKIKRIIERNLWQKYVDKGHSIDDKTLSDSYFFYRVEWEDSTVNIPFVPFPWVEKYPELLTQFKIENNL